MQNISTEKFKPLLQRQELALKALESGLAIIKEVVSFDCLAVYFFSIYPGGGLDEVYHENIDPDHIEAGKRIINEKYGGDRAIIFSSSPGEPHPLAIHPGMRWHCIVPFYMPQMFYNSVPEDCYNYLYLARRGERPFNHDQAVTLHLFGSLACNLQIQSEGHEVYKNYFNCLMNSLSSGCMVGEISGGDVIWHRYNGRALKTLGLKTQDAPSLEALFPGCSGEMMRALGSGGAGTCVEDKVIDYTGPDGEEKVLRINCGVFLKDRGSIKEFVAEKMVVLTVDDITAQAHSEKNLRETVQKQNQTIKKLARQVAGLQEKVPKQKAFIFRSPEMQRVNELINLVAEKDVSVLILGENGTGKELVAEQIKSRSKRKDGPFVKVNCASIPFSLMESELFGYERGAFTGAFHRKKGKFELADGGTVFLDEIGEIPPELQIKLLRVIQEKAFDRVGGDETVTVDVRIIAATNKNLELAIAQGQFRKDLYYRLNVFPILLPPLRQRKEDIPSLINHFIRHYSDKFDKKVEGIDREAMSRLLGYSYPGNIRELENIVQRAILLAGGRIIEAGNLPEEVSGGAQEGSEDGGVCVRVKPGEDLYTFSARAEKEYINWAIKKSLGNKTRASELLGISRRCLYLKLGKSIGDRS